MVLIQRLRSPHSGGALMGYGLELRIGRVFFASFRLVQT